MRKLVRSWVIAGAMLAVAFTGCRSSGSGCATCGGGGPMASNGTVIRDGSGTITTYTPQRSIGTTTPMPMPSYGNGQSYGTVPSSGSVPSSMPSSGSVPAGGIQIINETNQR